jgi:glycerophosphoryl diester phosphodiesterase
MISCDINNKCRIIAHRGFSSIAPENTIAAFQLALSTHADTIEMDIRLTKDLVPIVYHDETLSRKVIDLPEDLKNKKISEFYFDELQNFSIGKWFSEHYSREKIPRLKHALGLIKSKPVVEVILDIKDSSNLQAIINEVSESGFDFSKITWNVYDPDSASFLKSNGLIVSLNNGHLYSNNTYDTITTKSIETLPTEKVRYVYSLNDYNQFDKAYSSGFHGIMTKHPEALYNHLKKRFQYML